MAVVVAVWALILLVFRPPLLISAPLLAILLLGTLFFLQATSLAGSAGNGRQTGIGVHVEERVPVGCYELAVLKAPGALALDRWLEENGYAGLSEPDREIVSDYIADGWHFVAAKLRREKGGSSTPHPIAIEFPADRAVYPVFMVRLETPWK